MQLFKMVYIMICLQATKFRRLKIRILTINSIFLSCIIWFKKYNKYILKYVYRKSNLKSLNLKGFQGF
jgi:hypothetical protein